MKRRIALLGCLALVLMSPPWAPAQSPINPDVDRDGVVTSADVAIVRARLNRTCGQPEYLAAADVNSDCRINLTDQNIVSQNSGLRITGGAAPAANAAGWNTSNVTVSFTCAGPFTSCTAPVVVATEGAGRMVTGTVVGKAGAQMSVTIGPINLDKTPPAVTIASPANNFVTGNASIQVSGSLGAQLAPLAGVTCNGVAAAVTAADFACTVDLKVGNNTIEVSATDAAGNAGLASVSVLRQTEEPPPPPPVPPAPRIAITSPGALALFNGSQSPITVQGTVDDPNATVVVTVPDAPNGVAAGVKGTAWVAQNVPLREGHNLITARATNSQGGVATTTLTVNLDTTPPIVRINGPAAGALLTDTQAQVTGVVNDIVAGTVNSEEVTVTVNGVAGMVSNRTFVVPEVLLVRGTNTLRAVARDKAGNEAHSEIQVTVQEPVGQQRILLRSGNQQAAPIGAVLPDPLVVQLVDADGQPVADRPVTFVVSQSDGILAALDAQGQDLVVQTDAAGEASVQFQLGTRTGVGNNQVRATAPGFTGEVVFSASATVGLPSLINRVSGENQRGQVGQPLSLPFVVIVYDQGGNPVADVDVTFKVLQGGGAIHGVTEFPARTNSDGKAEALLTLGQQEGVNNQVVEVSYAGGLVPAVFSASALVAGNAADTTVSGVVLNNADQPIVGALASISGTGLTATTDQEGRFSIGSAPVGTLMLIVDAGPASTDTVKYPFLAFVLTTVAGTDNTVGMPIYIPSLDNETSKVVGGDTEEVLTMEGVPGVAFRIAPNSTTLPNGSKEAVRMVLSQVHADKVPMPPPNGSAPSLVWTLQPAGVHFDPPIEVQLPNTDGLAPGQVVEIFQFDHDLEQFVSVGQARVSADGSVITTDPGFGVTKSGWGAPQPPPPPKNCSASCNDQNVCTADTLINPPCVCQNSPANNGASCGGPAEPGANSCREPSVCKGGVCQGNFRDSGSCNDNVFCTENDECKGGGACVGTKIEDTEGPTFSVEIKIADDIKGALEKLKSVFGVLDQVSVTFTTEGKQKNTCCEAKQQKNVPIKTVKYTAAAKLETAKIFVPSLSFNVKLVKIGVFVKFGINGNVFLEGENDLCADQKCFKGGIQVGGSIEGGVAAEDAAKVVSISGSCGSGLQVDANVSCKEYQLGLSTMPLSCKFSLELFDGYVAINVQREVYPSIPLIGGSPQPLPSF